MRLVLGLLLATLAGGCTDWMTTAPRGLVVTVLYFDNRTGDDSLDVLGKGIADMMITDLAQVEGLTVVEREKLQEIVTELELQQTRFFDPATAGEIGKVVGATHAITGAIHAWAPDIRIDVRLVDVKTAEVALTDQVTGPKDRFFELEQDLATSFVEALEPTLPAPPQADRIEDGDLVLEYARGLDQLDRGELGTAYELLQALVERAPGFGLAAKRRDEAGGRIREARERREALLGEAHRTLLQNADEVLSGDITTLGEKGAGRWLGYRQVRGALFEGAASSLVVNATLGVGRTVPRKDRISFVAMLREYVDNAVKYNAELRAWHAKRKRVPTTSQLDQDDDARAGQLHVSWSRITPRTDDMALKLADAVCNGNLPAARPFGTNPKPPKIDAGLGESVAEELQRTIDDIAVFQKLHHERQTVRLMDRLGDCLLALGQRERAVATWQEALDRFPTSGEYDTVERKLLDNHRR